MSTHLPSNGGIGGGQNPFICLDTGHPAEDLREMLDSDPDYKLPEKVDGDLENAESSRDTINIKKTV